MSYEKFGNGQQRGENLVAMNEMSNAGVSYPTPVLQPVNLNDICPAPLVVEPQPFNVHLLDPLSQGMYNSLSTAHMSSAGLLTATYTAGSQLDASICGQFHHIKGSMSYSELLNGLLHKGESIVQQNAFQHLQYSHISLCDQSNTSMSQRSAGICLLSNKRLLILSSQVTKSMSMSSFGNPKKLPGGYSLDAYLGDTTSYLPIPLRCLKSIEMNGQSGVHGKVMINGREPCCCGWCGAFASCLGAQALKQWEPGVVSIEQNNNMVITIGVLMPPWDQKMFLNIHATITTPLPVVRDFISLIQQYAPSLN